MVPAFRELNISLGSVSGIASPGKEALKKEEVSSSCGAQRRRVGKAKTGKHEPGIAGPGSC
jgi:hypothetical protein